MLDRDRRAPRGREGLAWRLAMDQRVVTLRGDWRCTCGLVLYRQGVEQVLECLVVMARVQ